MIKLCKDEFWNSSFTWYTESPDFTDCFKKTLLTCVPCLFLWLFFYVDIYYMRKSKSSDLPWKLLNISKFSVTIFLTLLSVLELLHNLSTYKSLILVDVLSPLFKIITFILSAVLLFYNKKYGIRSSGLLFLFWFLLVICGVPQFQSDLSNLMNSNCNFDYCFLYLIFYSLYLLMLILNCFVDLEPNQNQYSQSKMSWPENEYSFLSRIMFVWLDDIMWKGFKQSLNRSDMWELQPEETADEIVPVFERYLKNNSLHKVSFQNPEEIELVGKKTEKKFSIVPSLLKTFWPIFVCSAFFKLVFDIFLFVNPQILKLLLSFIKNNEEQWKGYLYALLFFCSTTFQTLFLAQHFQRTFIMGMRMRTALISTIYRKSLRISNVARKNISTGEIVNLMAVDAQRFVDLCAILNLIWSAPLQIILALVFLWKILGPSVLAGLSSMIILISVNIIVVNKVKVLQTSQMNYKDERIKLINEVLNGMKVLKMYAWEPSFEEAIISIRKNEIKILKQIAFYNAFSSFIWTCVPFLVCLSSFATFILIAEENLLTPEIAFVSLSLYNILQFPLNMLPNLISLLIQVTVSVKRINNFLNSPELYPDDIEHDYSEKSPLVIENGNFNWDEKNILNNIDLKFERAQLTAVVGTVGSGKSSLISAILGEMNKTSGRVNVVGNIAYVPQQAWILNLTLRDNIIFGRTFNRQLYQKVLDACELIDDINVLPDGDQTEIGEKGINLSGGQKQRVSLARAIYANAEIYLLDDPLSAVDIHVGKNIFDNVIGPNGMLRNKTRILVTHAISFLPNVDRVIVLTNGVVSEIGTYKVLIESKGAFSEFLKNHTAETKLSDYEEIENGTNNSQMTLTTSMRQQSSSFETNAETEKLVSPEKTEIGKVKWSVYKFYINSVGLFAALMTIVMHILFQIFSISSNFWLSKWSSESNLAINGTVNSEKNHLYLGTYGLLGVGQAISILLSSVFLYLGTLKGAYVLHKTLLFNVMRASCNNFFDVTPIGRILNRFSKDIDIVDSVFPSNIRSFLSTSLMVLATVLVISITTPVFISVIIPLGFIYYFVQKFYVATSRQLKRLQSITQAPIYSHFSESLAGTSSIRAYGVQNRFIQQNEKNIYENQIFHYPNVMTNRWLAIRLEMIGNIVIFFSALLAVVEKRNAGNVGLSVSYALQITQSLNWLVRMVSELETNIVNVERIKEYENIPREGFWKTNNKSPPIDWPTHGFINFKNCTLKYRSNLDFVLKGVSFTINSCEKIGVVGRTGAGKSSLTLALFRIVELDDGEITIDSINISEIGLHDLRTCLTIIPQDPVLFSGTVRNNLDPLGKFTDEEIWKSLENAHLKSFVLELRDGLDHKLQESGENISVGQRQLICLSRALLRKTKVLILDEATAAIDLETDDLIQKTIRNEFKDCTVITIAHRLNTIMDSDKILVLDKGSVVEFDTPTALLSNTTSSFYNMAKDAGII